MKRMRKGRFRSSHVESQIRHARLFCTISAWSLCERLELFGSGCSLLPALDQRAVAVHEGGQAAPAPGKEGGDGGCDFGPTENAGHVLKTVGAPFRACPSISIFL